MKIKRVEVPGFIFVISDEEIEPGDLVINHCTNHPLMTYHLVRVQEVLKGMFFSVEDSGSLDIVDYHKVLSVNAFQ